MPMGSATASVLPGIFGPLTSESPRGETGTLRQLDEATGYSLSRDSSFAKTVSFTAFSGLPSRRRDWWT